jgi:outer membrane usher protein
VPFLSPYQNNSVRIDPRELPISAGIDSIEQSVVPGYRSAVKVTFPVRSGHGALLRIVLDDGDVAPAGAVIRIAGDDEEFFVARRGEAFATGLQSNNRIILHWRGQECQFEVSLPPITADEIPRIGPLQCPGLSR